MLSESKGGNKRNNKITTLEKAQHFLLEWKIVQIYDFWEELLIVLACKIGPKV